MTKDFYQCRIQEWGYWYRSIVSKALDKFKFKSFYDHSLVLSVLSPASRVQRPASKVQSPEPRVQHPESSVQLLRWESRNSGMPFSSEKVNIWTPSGYFPFLCHFPVEMKQTRNLQKKKTGETWKIVKPITLQRNFFEVTGYRLSYHYARNIYIKFFSKMLYWNLASLFKNAYSYFK